MTHNADVTNSWMLFQQYPYTVHFVQCMFCNFVGKVIVNDLKMQQMCGTVLFSCYLHALYWPSSILLQFSALLHCSSIRPSLRSKKRMPCTETLCICDLLSVTKLSDFHEIQFFAKICWASMSFRKIGLMNVIHYLGV